ncbi:tail fiber assembly protein [Serratia nematodiphila]|nr:tail fiber assembly protein [Serratia marcescens]HBK4670701.1 tail fiber assembly protein [Serratia marcescens]
MKTMKSLGIYVPKEPKLGESVLYLKCESGHDWYDSQSDFMPDSVKIAFNQAGVICCASVDVSMLWPINMSVAEIPKSDVPNGFYPDGSWFFDGSVIFQSKVIVVEKERSERNAFATAIITPLQDAVDSGISTPEEEAKLLEWKKYRALLSRVDAGQDEILWPDQPVG